MSLYVMLMNLTDKGLQQVHAMTKLMGEVKKLVEERGGKLHAAYAVLGRHDIVAIVEAPDNKTITRISALIVASGNFRAETFPAVSIEELIEK
jgi:uncharacterized protein with GYD domain